MKICQLCAVDFTLYRFLMPLIEAEAKAGHEVVAVCADGPLVARLREGGLRVETVAFTRRLISLDHLANYRALVRLFRAEQFDMVHVHTPIAAFIGRLAARAAGVPCIVYTAHGFYFHDRMSPFKRAVFIALEWLAGRATHVLFTQAAEDADTASRLGLCRTGVVEAIGNGVDPERFHPGPETHGQTRSEVRRRLDTPDDAVVVMVIGRLIAEKGFPELLTAVRDLDIHLWVVGERLASDHDRNVEAELNAAQASNFGPRLQLLGARDDVDELLRAADIYTLPSHREGMPRSIIEAMMSGLPVVATDIRGSREEVIDGETGRLLPVGDVAGLRQALVDLAGDADLRTSWGEAGRARALALYDEAEVIARQLRRLGLD